MKAAPANPVKSRAKVIPLQRQQHYQQPVPRALFDGRHSYFTNTNGRRWGR